MNLSAVGRSIVRVGLKCRFKTLLLQTRPIRFGKWRLLITTLYVHKCSPKQPNMTLVRVTSGEASLCYGFEASGGYVIIAGVCTRESFSCLYRAISNVATRPADSREITGVLETIETILTRDETRDIIVSSLRMVIAIARRDELANRSPPTHMSARSAV